MKEFQSHLRLPSLPFASIPGQPQRKIDRSGMRSTSTVISCRTLRSRAENNRNSNPARMNACLSITNAW